MSYGGPDKNLDEVLHEVADKVLSEIAGDVLDEEKGEIFAAAHYVPIRER